MGASYSHGMGKFAYTGAPLIRKEQYGARVIDSQEMNAKVSAANSNHPAMKGKPTLAYSNEYGGGVRVERQPNAKRFAESSDQNAHDVHLWISNGEDNSPQGKYNAPESHKVGETILYIKGKRVQIHNGARATKLNLDHVLDEVRSEDGKEPNHNKVGIAISKAHNGDYEVGSLYNSLHPSYAAIVNRNKPANDHGEGHGDHGHTLDDQVEAAMKSREYSRLHAHHDSHGSDDHGHGGH